MTLSSKSRVDVEEGGGGGATIDRDNVNSVTGPRGWVVFKKSKTFWCVKVSGSISFSEVM